MSVLLRSAAVAAAASLALVGCSTDATPAPSTLGSTPAPTAAATTPTTSSHVFTFGEEWTLAPASQAQGSGCTPGAGQLQDGVWFGFAKEWSTTQIAFDLACWWTGAAAEAEAASRGEEAFDFYITNDNTTVRLVTVDGDVPAKKAGADDGVFTLSEVIADPGGSLPTASPYPVWIYVNGGVVTAIAVQYVP